MSEIQELVDGLAARTGRAVVLEDPRLRLIAYSHTDEDVDDVRLRSILRRESPEDVRAWLFAHGLSELSRPTVMPALDALGMGERVCCPVRWADARLGYLWVLGAGDAVLAAAAETAALAGPILYRDRLADDSRRAAEIAALEQAVFDAEGALPGCVSVVRVPDGAADGVLELQSALERALRGHSGGVGRCLHRGRELVLVGGSEADQRAALGATGAPRGMGADLADARQAALIAELLGSEDPMTADQAPLQSYLLATAGGDPARLRIAAAARALLAADPALAATVEAYLDQGGDIRRTTAMLHISRAGLYRKLRRAEAVAGIDLRDGTQRTVLHLSLKAARLLE